MVKDHYLARVAYNEDFIEDMQLFLKNIKLDARINALAKNKNQLFSVSIRYLIKKYNDNWKAYLLKKAQERKENATSNSSD
jgi:hypothetical protein